MFSRFNGNVEPFASNATGTNRTVFGDTVQSDDIDDNLNADFKLGWEIVGVNDNPTKQDFNALAYTISNLVAYLYQQGVAQWNTNQEYYVGNVVFDSDGNLRKSKTGTSGTPNQGNDPTTDDTNWENVSLKNFDVVKASSGASWAPNEYKYLFMNKADYEAYNASPADSVTNQFHFFSTSDNARVEFECNPGNMQFYIEGGVGKEVWYGLQEEATHAWSIGMNTAIDRSIRFCTGFGIGSKNPALKIQENGKCIFQDLEATEQSFFTVSGVGVAPIIIKNPDVGGNGLLVKAEGGAYLADFRDLSEVSKARITASGEVQAPNIFGYSQSWSNVTASRSAGVTYTNSTGKPIEVAITFNTGSNKYIYVDGNIIGQLNDGDLRLFFTFTVPNGSTYAIESGSTIDRWMEFR